MIRTQIQLPDELHERLKRIAEEQEMSLAEVVRRGAEYMINVCPPCEKSRDDWEPPAPVPLGSNDPFADEDWREQLHMGTGRALRVAESRKNMRKYGRKE